MKRLCPLLLTLCLLLGGCGRNLAADRYETFSEELRAKDAIRMTAEVRADYPDRSVSFTLRCEQNGEGSSVSVLAPEEIRGVTVHLDGAASALGYDSIVIDTGPLDRYGLSPVGALPRLIDALREGHLESAWEEDGQTVWQLVPDDELTVQVWLDGDLTPVYAELISEGRVVVCCDISEWK